MPSLRIGAPLTVAEQARLEELPAFNEEGMNVEEMDGFFSALIAGPDIVPPSEALPQVFGGAADPGRRIRNLGGCAEAAFLFMRHCGTGSRERSHGAKCTYSTGHSARQEQNAS